MAMQTNATEWLDNAQIAIKISHTFGSPCLGTVSQRTSKNTYEKKKKVRTNNFATRHIDWAPRTKKNYNDKFF